MARTRPPAVAGTFYPRDPAVLRRMVDELMDRGRAVLEQGTRELPLDVARVKALVVPHAGYVYSGSTAAVGYALAERLAGRIERVVLLGPVHHVPVRGLALPEADAFRTPLGDVPVDSLAGQGGAARLALPQLGDSAAAHAPEHSLEVQFPLLQTVLPGAVVVPLAVGSTRPEEVADVLDALWGGPETLVVVSSDLSHYLPYEDARRVDAATLDDVLALRELDHRQACGASPLNGLLEASRRHQLQPRVLAACNSGDTAGDRSRVVGYASLCFQGQA